MHWYTEDVDRAGYTECTQCFHAVRVRRLVKLNTKNACSSEKKFKVKIDGVIDGEDGILT